MPGTFEVCLSHPSFRGLKTGRHHRRGFGLNVCVGFPGRVRWISGCGLERFPTDPLFPPVSALHLLGVGDRCTGTGAVHSAVGRPGLPQPAVNPQMWRFGVFYCYSISGRFPHHVLCFMGMSGRSWGRSHWVPGKEFIF